MVTRVASLLVILLLPGCTTMDNTYTAEIDAWHVERIERLRSDTGWMTLVGLHALPPGNHSLGSAPSADITIIEKAPARIGTLSVRNGRVRFTADPDVDVREFRALDEESVRTIDMLSDAAGEPTTLEVGTILFYVIDRNDELFLRVKDRESAALASFTGIERFPVDPRYRVEAVLEPEAHATIAFNNVLGQREEQPSPGVLRFELDGEALTLRPSLSRDGSLFIVFADETSGETTYGGGRFLDADAPDEHGRVTLDFNTAHNPVCSWSPYATCPLPTPGNRLPVAIRAGEKHVN